MKGNLYIHVLGARNLFTKDRTPGGSDPYVKVYLDNKKIFKTPALHKTVDPEWDRSRNVTLSTEENYETLRFSIWNSNVIKWDEFLGEVSFPLETLYDGVPREGWYTLQPHPERTSIVTGDIHLQILYISPHLHNVVPDEIVFSQPLHYLLRNRLTDGFRTALEIIKEVDTKDNEGKTPLHLACQKDLPGCVEDLLHNSANPQEQDNAGALPVHYAAAHSPRSLELLLGAGRAQVSDVDKRGRQAVHHAALANKPESIKVLAERGADLNDKDVDGKTALHLIVHEKEEDLSEAAWELMKCGASIDLPDNLGVTVAELCLESHLHARSLAHLPRSRSRSHSFEQEAYDQGYKDHHEDAKKIHERTLKEIMRGAGIRDEREFALRKRFKTVYYVEANDLSEVLDENRQFAVWAPRDAHFSVLMHQNFENFEEIQCQMELNGFMVIRSKQGVHKEPSYHQDLLGYGSYEPFEISSETKKYENENKYYIIMPFAKAESARGYYDIIVYSDSPLHITELKEWEYKTTIEGEWGPGFSGGHRAEGNGWLRNPQFRLKLSPPKDSDTNKDKEEIGILLAQSKSVLDIFPYSLIPYEFFIGQYILDKDMFDIVAESDKWRNSQEVYTLFSYQFKEEGNEFVIIPTTQLPNQMTSFKLTIFSDVPCELTPNEMKGDTIGDLQEGTISFEKLNEQTQVPVMRSHA